MDIYAGETALKQLQQHGFQQSLFTSMIGASGGPKWFTLFQWDKYLFGEFFKDRQEPLNIIGSSAGAFRAACFAQQDPVAAITRLATHYSQTVYQAAKPTPAEITQSAIDILDIMLGEDGVSQIINNPIIKAHFIVAKANGLVGQENKLLQGLGLARSYMNNRHNRALLGKQFERFIFQPQHSDFAFVDPDQIPTSQVMLTEANLKQALLASGAIPMVMQGIRNIQGCPAGMYRDGGIIDYHFDMQINTSGLVLYPHFTNQPKAGWFDKGLKRGIRAENFDNVVMLTPSAEFIASLPYGKIPDRNDFTQLSNPERLAYWQQVFQQTEALAQALDNFIHQPSAQKWQQIKPISALA